MSLTLRVFDQEKLLNRKTEDFFFNYKDFHSFTEEVNTEFGQLCLV